MNSMVERVARNLAAKHDKEHNTTGATLAYNAGSIATDYWNTLAKAAIAAMREPTEEMIDAGINRPYGVAVWTAMIDVALKE